MSHPVLHVQLLGGFQFVLDDTPVAGVSTARLQSLIAYLILHADSPQSRQHLAFLFWPDATEAQARNNLRQFLYQLRHALPDAEHFLAVDSNTVYWKTDAAQVIDVQLFERTLSQAAAAEQQGEAALSRQALERALAFYQGDLLPGCYDDWMAPERERLQQQARSACQKLVLLLETQRHYAAALPVAQQLLRLDPLDESAYAMLMRLHELDDDPAGAQRVYQSAVETLQCELGVEPGEALHAAYQRLQRTPRPSSSLGGEETAAAAYQLVGRQAEWQQLQAAWQRAAGGGAHLVLITGEAGIGKSRLAEELFQWVTRQGFATAHTRSYGAEGRLSLAPITDWVRSPALRPHLAGLDSVWLEEIARLLPELLSDYPQLTRPQPIAEYGRRQHFFEALARGVLAAPQPLLLWIDDLQWCDQETLEWLHFLLRFAPRTALLILGTARSEESPPDHPLSALARQLRAENRVAVCELAPLDAAETATLAFQVQGQSLDATATMRLYRETEGNPLFVVETVRAGAAPGQLAQTDLGTAANSPDASILPPRVQAIIAGRLAQLSPTARKVAEIGAVIGRAFTLDLLLLAGHEEEEVVIHALDELWQKRIVSEQRVNVFDFTHDKLREVTYAETNLPQRRLLHRRIAQALETLHAEELDPISAKLATHYEQAGLFKQAIAYYQRAGAVAASVYANDNAIELLTHGLTLLTHLAAGAQRDIQELNLHLALAPLYRITKGWTSPEIEQCLNRTLILSDKAGDASHRLQALYGLQSLNVVAARLEKVQYTYPEMHTLFKQIQGDITPFAGLMYTGAKLHMGKIAEAREQFERIVAERDSRHIHDLQESQGVNYLVLGYAWNAHALWCLGHVHAAHASAQNAIAIARKFEQPFNQALAITYMATLQEWRADAGAFFAQARDAYALTSEYQVTYYHAWARILLHFAQAWQHPDRSGLAQLRDAIHRFIDMGSRLRLPLYFSLLARACWRAGEIDDALEAIEQGLTEALQNNERWWDAELHRLRGELMWAQGADPDDVEAALQRALDIAQAQQSRSLELRAATDLARLWQATERPEQARHSLVRVYGGFREGFDTPDLQSAQAFIAQL